MSAKTTYQGDVDVLNACNSSQVFYQIHLFQNNFVPSEASVLGDFTEATFDGYAAQIFSFGAAFVNGTPAGQMNASSYTWVKAVGAVTNTIYGMYITDIAGNVSAYELFAAPIPMVVPGVDNIPYQYSPTALAA